jgi:putative phosphoribosyl transferase
VPLHFAHRFKDRYDAARKLAVPLKKFAKKKAVFLLAIPGGGVPIGAFLAKELHLPLDVALVKKLPAPATEELAIGAIAVDGTVILDDSTVKDFSVSDDYIEREKRRLLGVLHKKDTFFHQSLPALAAQGKTVILVDDGIATGQTTRAAVEMLRRKKVKKLIVVTPVSSAQAAKEISALADEFISLVTEKTFYAVGTYYGLFPHVGEEEVLALLEKSRVGAGRSRSTKK